MVAGIGCIVQSALTLLVFFPRSIAQENGFTLLAQPSVGVASFQPHGEPTGDNNDDYGNFDYDNGPPVTSLVAMTQLSSMPSPEEDFEYRRKPSEWISNQPAHSRQQASLYSEAHRDGAKVFRFGSRARSGSVSSAAGSFTLVGANGAIAQRPFSTVSQHSDYGENRPIHGELERNTNRDTLASMYSATDASLSPTSTLTNHIPLPPSYGPASPVTPGTSHQRRPFATAPFLPTVMEPGPSRTATARPVASPPRSLASPRNAHMPPRSNARQPSFPANLEAGENFVLSSPFDDDCVVSETASVCADTIDQDASNGVSDMERGHLGRSSSTSKVAHPITPGGRLGTIATSVSREKNDLADVPFEAMRAMGGRYSELAVQRAAARGEEIHPYVRTTSYLPRI